MSNPEWWNACRDDWVRVLTPWRGEIKRVLEVGSWEGHSAVFWLRFFGAEVDCIDNWENSTLARDVAAKVESNFDANTAGLSITKFRGDSTFHLYELGCAGSRYDLVYIDGDHRRNQVMIDSVLAWPLLRSGGIMIWDDWALYPKELPDKERPERGIRCFLEMIANEWEHLADTGRQLYVRKVGGAT